MTKNFAIFSRYTGHVLGIEKAETAQNAIDNIIGNYDPTHVKAGLDFDVLVVPDDYTIEDGTDDDTIIRTITVSTEVVSI